MGFVLILILWTRFVKGKWNAIDGAVQQREQTKCENPDLENTIIVV